MFLYGSYLFLISLYLLLPHISLSMGEEIDYVQHGIQNLSIANDYDSDSEDEEGYTYQGLPHLTISDNKKGTTCVPLFRGIHFSSSRFTKQQRSQLRKANDSGVDVFSSAAYDLVGNVLGSDAHTDQMKEHAIAIRERIKQLSPKDRNLFQQIYSNNYDGFHQRLGTDKEGGIFKKFESKKNPQVSTSEDFIHSGKYAAGLKYLGADTIRLNPEYDESGKPKHPYLGKLFAILINTDEIEMLDPYFVVHGHANDDITISTHQRKDVLSEREAALPGFIPGNCVVLSVPIRVPSFKEDYKSCYQEKFGISKKSYNARKKLLAKEFAKKEEIGKKESINGTIKTLLIDVILPHLSEKIKQHVKNESEAHNIQLVYKQLNGMFGRTLPPLVNATDHKKRIKQRKKLN